MVVWIGRTANASEDNVVLVVNEGRITGSIHGPGGFYTVSPLGGALHAVVKQNPSNGPPEHPPDFSRIERGLPIEARAKALKRPSVAGGADPPPATPRSNAPADPTPAPVTANYTLEVMVLYTPAVATAVPDVNGLIALAITETNLGYTNSGVHIAADLAYSGQVDYTESGDFQNDLYRLAGKSDGFMDDIHPLRDSVKADVVLLLIDNQQYRGFACAIGATEDQAFAAVNYRYATGYYSFGHEIGHLEGARHDTDHDPSMAPRAYAHGYTHPTKHWHTIMAHTDTVNPDRILHWSNPDILYNGDPTGTPDTCNNARVLNETAPTVTSFR
jgi:hypothetical protein